MKKLLLLTLCMLGMQAVHASDMCPAESGAYSLAPFGQECHPDEYALSITRIIGTVMRDMAPAILVQLYRNGALDAGVLSPDYLVRYAQDGMKKAGECIKQVTDCVDLKMDGVFNNIEYCHQECYDAAKWDGSDSIRCLHETYVLPEAYGHLPEAEEE
jgi:hypothetical protein